MSGVWFVMGGWLFACATTSTLHTSSVVCLGMYCLGRLLVSCVAYLNDGIVLIDRFQFHLVLFTWCEMNLEAVSLIHIANACVGGVDH